MESRTGGLDTRSQSLCVLLNAVYHVPILKGRSFFIPRKTRVRSAHTWDSDDIKLEIRLAWNQSSLSLIYSCRIVGAILGSKSLLNL